ncbi:MAG: Gar1/Naf1 family protein [Methanobacterium paludis]|jgi:RNA-binding protein|uniref:H/ACA RNA-protein complex component Gar1 n=1 Tax=Methanobacterium paludis (strain DSM 25820 / JCM 18151 / SWAN1) TaxID=868131 RepID=F6D305_METPW|nr:Gar1/Naf1 family protein [Methanobacterium paludis]AEG17368.1 H/ACA RNA-protein complex component Gar1 [Methanobacterium paludis]MCE7698990.1 Gar1/Naf1 family protein [Methanobacterium paludis]
MKKLGTVSHISKRGRVILKSVNTPGFGLTVFTEDKKKLGTVYDIFGPTKESYVAIKVYSKNFGNLDDKVGETLYIPSKPIKKWGRRKRKKK